MSYPPELVRAFSKKSWRMNNLYKIRNKNGLVIPFKRNSSQKKLASIKHPRKITTKARQLGISTDAVIDALDSCIFVAGTQAGIQSYGLTESAKLRGKAKLAWEQLPQAVKDFVGLKLISKYRPIGEFHTVCIIRDEFETYKVLYCLW